jgi:tetratricopeptide (TPR) repeat protein
MVRFEEFAQARWYLDRSDVATNVDYAMSILNRVVKEEPGFAMAHAALGEAAWQKWLATRTRSWADEAQRHALEALRLSPQQPEIRYSVALIYQGTGRSKEALAELEEVARVRPLNDEVPRLMGRLYADAGRVDEGIALLRRAIDLRPGYWNNHATLGNIAFRAGRYDEAIAAFRRFTELRPDSASAHQRLGTAYHASGDVAAALASYQRALAIAPNANAYSNVGTIHYDERRYALAVDAYRRAVGLDPRNQTLHRNLADALRRAGQTRAAREAYLRAIELAGAVLDVDPDNAAAMNVRAISLARIGRLAEAEAASRAALARQPKSSTVLFDRGVILLLLGRKADAVETMKAALAAGYSVQRFASDPDLAALSDQPGFRDLVKRQP